MLKQSPDINLTINLENKIPNTSYAIHSQPHSIQLFYYNTPGTYS